MHLAGALNIKTVSFFGNNLFASSKRWATISNSTQQNNFVINNKTKIKIIEKAVVESLS
jgi:ADP-heptose:LPS heptosyltransferase